MCTIPFAGTAGALANNPAIILADEPTGVALQMDRIITMHDGMVAGDKGSDLK